VKAAVEKMDVEESAAAASLLAETVLKADRIDLLDPVLSLLECTGQQDFLHIFSARAAAQQGDTLTAEREYAAVLEAVAPAGRGEVQVEFASYLYGRDEYERAAELFETSGIWAEDERSVRMYARSTMSGRSLPSSPPTFSPSSRTAATRRWKSTTSTTSWCWTRGKKSR
jgi:hypothetical protein